MAKMGGKSCIANYFLSFSAILMNLAQMFALGCRCARHIFFDSGRKSVAMVMAKMGEKSCVANYFLSFSPILMKFGTDVFFLTVAESVLPW